MHAIAGLLYGPEFHHLDHLAPLCAEKKIPLFVTDQNVHDQAISYYPDLICNYFDQENAKEKIIQSAERFYVCTPRPLFEEEFGLVQKKLGKCVETIWCPHGNSDKGRSTSMMSGLSQDQKVVTYGKRIEEFMDQDGLNLPKERMGNYRLAYFEKHQLFYAQFFQKTAETTLLYAPTWQDDEKSSSFPELWSTLLKVPSHFRLLVKLHPHLYRQYPEEISLLRELKPENLILIEDFPPVYPLLSVTDIFIGDLSSVGYDFLCFNRPMILLFPSPLSQAGTYLPKDQWIRLFALCKEVLDAPMPTHNLLEETFGGRL